MGCSLKVGKYYNLVPLKKIEKDDLLSLEREKVFFICNYPDDRWHEKHNIEVGKSSVLHKKDALFAKMGSGSVIVSPTRTGDKIKTKSVNDGKVMHIGTAFTNKYISVIVYTIKIIVILLKNKKRYTAVANYNFDFPGFLVCLFSKVFLNKKIIIDFEDDYMYRYGLIRRLVFKNIFTKIPDEVVLVNRAMSKYFRKSTQKYVVNVYNDFEYLLNCRYIFKKGDEFLISGGLDEIRGGDLIEHVASSLDELLGDYRIHVVGTGPLENMVRSLAQRNQNIIYHGFVSKSQLDDLLQKVDCCLVLQKPDHPFSKGSFPSKVEDYLSKKKPILVLECYSEPG